MTILENDINKFSGYWTYEDISDDECKDENENCFMARGETSEVRPYNSERCNELQDILDLTLKESQKMMNELKRLNSHSSVKSNQATYKSTKKGPTRTESTSTSGRSKNGSPSGGFENPKTPNLSNTNQLGPKQAWVTKINGGSVKFGDDSKGKIVGTDTVPFNNNCDITEVYLVDGLNYNLLSISQLCDSGYEVKFKKTGCATEEEIGKIILQGKRYGNVYILNGFENIDGHICLTSMSDDPWLCNKKLGHASMHLIDKLSKHYLVIGLTKLNFSRSHVCDACQIGKQTRNPFKIKDIVSTSKPLQLLHMDLFGPNKTAIIGGKRYAFVIIDDYSRFTWVNFLSHKDEALKNFEIYCKRVEREKGYLITTIHKESVHVVFDENNTSAEKGIIASDEDQNQEMTQSSNIQETTTRVESVTESTDETSNSQPETHIESTNPTSTTRPNEWISEPEYPPKFIIRYPNEGMKTRGAHKKKANLALISQIEPKKIDKALKDSSWVHAIQEELDQFDKNKVWKLMPKHVDATVIGTQWVFRNKLNEEGKVIRNKAKLVAQRYSQQEGVDYDETFTPVDRLESIRILLAYSSFKTFRLFQMDVSSAF
ncbi:uncharacterized protein LOC142169185 [Nicotiana tabacum]|uniref:Uncharacterized protein LOC142169185 n=1 Tax=Nicotiana tabacum TaxID=4097 RepID=A0AC58SNH8_TOBAC